MGSKVFILGISFSDSTGAGVTLNNLFSKFDYSNIAFADYDIHSDNLKYSKYLFNLSNNCVLNTNSTKTFQNEPASKYSFYVLFKKIFFKGMGLLIKKYLAYYYNNYSVSKITKELVSFINNYCPDYIYIIPYNRKIIKLALSINSLMNIPIVVHFMDDYRKRSPIDIFYPINELLTRKIVKEIVNRSYKRLAICESMAIDYESIFKREFKYFHNPIKIESFRKNVKKNNINCLNFLYTGTIAENNFDTLFFFANCIEKLGFDNNISLDIYAPVMSNNPFYNKFYNKIRNYHFVKLHKSVSHEKLLSLMYEYNILFLPLTFKKKYHSVIKISFPTKVAEYMASGIPTLYFIPRNIALHKFIQDNNIGFIFDKRDANELINFLLDLINGDFDLAFDKNARNIAFSKFDINKVSKEFKEIFN